MTNFKFLVLATALCAVNVVLGQVPETFTFLTQSDSTIFYLSDFATDWASAQDSCVNYGGHLGTFSSLNENNLVYSSINFAGIETCQFGLIQNNGNSGGPANSGWAWVDGTPLTFTNWASGEPNDGGSFSNEYVATFRSGGRWNDRYGYNFRFILEISDASVVMGCSDVNACNYDAEVTFNDNSCIYPGCTDPDACNYNEFAGCSNETCAYGGCNNSLACNYNAQDVCDADCIFPLVAGDCNAGSSACSSGMNWNAQLQKCETTNASDINADGCVNLGDLLDLLSGYGTCTSTD